MSLKKRLAVGVLSLSATGLIGIASYEGFSEKAYIPIKAPGGTATLQTMLIPWPASSRAWT